MYWQDTVLIYICNTLRTNIIAFYLVYDQTKYTFMWANILRLCSTKLKLQNPEKFKWKNTGGGINWIT